ncbi:MAG: zinc metallopeptidase [Candidatus Omnitrophica bacterium]|nr:zinc metallopeptidase [Candidatus Omnitrophota bacterium]
MQVGLFFLSLFAFTASLIAWIRLEICLARNGKSQTRRLMNGYELARQVLDHNHFNRVAITASSGRRGPHFSFDFDRLFLSEKVYYGTRISDQAHALHEAGHFLEGSKSILPANIRIHGERLLRGAVLVSWISILIGFVLRVSSILMIGETLFVLAFLIALVALVEEFDITERILSNLKVFEGYNKDELIRMRKILKAFRWVSLAELIRGPMTLWPIKT